MNVKVGEILEEIFPTKSISWEDVNEDEPTELYQFLGRLDIEREDE